MKRAAEAASRHHGAADPEGHPPQTGGLRRPLLVGIAATLVIGVGMLAVAVDATPGAAEARWFGRLDGDVSGRAERLLSAMALGLGAEVERAQAGRDAALHDVRQQLDALGRQRALLLERLRSEEAQPGVAAEIAAIKSATPSLQTEVKGLRLVAAALLLREGALSARPFELALDRFALVAGSLPATVLDVDPDFVPERIEALRPYAEHGVVSMRDLRRSFAMLATMVDRAAGLSWWDQAMVMVGMRDDPLQPLHDAGAAWLVDDLPAAVAALSTLQGEPGLVAEEWLQLAQARLTTDAIVDELYRMALAVGVESLGTDEPVASSGGTTPTRRALPAAGPWSAAQSRPLE